MTLFFSWVRGSIHGFGNSFEQDNNIGAVVNHVTFCCTTVPAGTNEARKYFVQNFLKHLFLVLV